MENECEICGSITQRLFRREVENVIMYLCVNCKSLGTIPKADVQRKKTKHSQSSSTSKFRSLYSEQENRSVQNRGGKHDRPAYSRKSGLEGLKIVDNVSKILFRLRSKEGLSHQEFAKSLLVKENYYRRIEKGTTPLPIDLARKIEKKYHIKLVEKDTKADIENYSKFLKDNKQSGQSMIYFRKRGQEPKYDQ